MHGDVLGTRAAGLSSWLTPVPVQSKLDGFMVHGTLPGLQTGFHAPVLPSYPQADENHHEHHSILMILFGT